MINFMLESSLHGNVPTGKWRAQYGESRLLRSEGGTRSCPRGRPVPTLPPRMGKPCTWGRESGTSVDRRGGMHNERNCNLTVDYPPLRVITSSMRGNSMTTLAG